WYGGPRQATLDDPDTEEDERVGQWSTWSFDVAEDGAVTIGSDWTGTTASSGPVDNMDTIWISGGGSGDTTYGVLVDNITAEAVPEPASIGLLAIALTALLWRRQMRE
ncbi:MAG: PEP-CTERM sorting domain-containing protein, partial [Planctomycetota bacterium]